MPRLSESMEEGTVVSWLVPDGAPVTRGQEIAEIETDKATLPYEAPESGVLRILVPEGSTLALGQPIGLIDDLAPLPGGHSVAPPGLGSPAAGGQVPGPRAPYEDPATASYELHPDLHEPHVVHASSPPPAPSPDPAWSPAWGPQPPARGAEPHHHDDEEGETTEFEAVDPSIGQETSPAWATPTHRDLPAEPPVEAAPQPAAVAPQHPVAPAQTAP
ncbi:MAG: biotin/lipoyl-containing protein, partial [Patulibacter sp.]|nr:biotin/lipoyl-containing protein [Patulibacter sp.]